MSYIGAKFASEIREGDFSFMHPVNYFRNVRHDRTARTVTVTVDGHDEVIPYGAVFSIYR